MARICTSVTLSRSRTAPSGSASATADITWWLRPDSAASMRARVGGIARLAEHLPVEHHDGVGAQHRTPAAIALAPSHGLATRQAPREVRRRLAGKRGFIDVHGQHFVRHADLGQQFAPSGRGRGKNDGAGGGRHSR